jgi:hypothetical protein
MPPTRSRGARAAAALVVAAAVFGGWALVHDGAGPLPDPQRCVATAGGNTASVDLDQARNASTIAAVAVRRGLPARAVSIALAAAFQESGLRNLDHGDRDSLGLFQQRPSQGWGTARQVRNPVHAANRFYDALEQVSGYQQMAIADAAQRVQRSAFGGAYAGHEADARSLASALTGYSAAAISCVVDLPATPGTPGRVVAALATAFGRLGPASIGAGGLGPAGVRAAHNGKALALRIGGPVVSRERRGWVLASYLVANAARLSIREISFAGRVWVAGDASSSGWRHTRGGDAGQASTDQIRVVVA